MFVKPKAGLKVRDPDTLGFLPATGAQVRPSLYWTRRLRDGDVVAASPPSPQPAPAAAQAVKEPSK